MARALMFQGTGSDVGKTVLVAGLCRAACNRGLNVKPFKPQNMSNNAAVADDGGEIGRGQWLQAVACKVPPSVHMNPVLLKPQSETGAQIILQGKYFGNAKARDYARLKQKLTKRVVESFEFLSRDSQLVLVEGAGSPAEVNLRAGDIANMGFAEAVDIPVVLIGDIDRGGVIASLVGTFMILEPKDRQRIKAYIINKFRGDVSLFNGGLQAIAKYTNWVSLGIVPWLSEMAILPAEDSMNLKKIINSDHARVKIAVPITSHIANFDDLDPLINEQGVDVVFVHKSQSFPLDANAVILPGSKSTIAGMAEMRANGWCDQIIRLAQSGAQIVGICGGYQMLGKKITDPDGIEGLSRDIEGLGLLQVETHLAPKKILKNRRALSQQFGVEVAGYEIHMGKTTGVDCSHPVFKVNNIAEGAMAKNERVWGSYLHGLFNSGEFRKRFLAELGAKSDAKSHFEKVDQALNRIADELEEALNLDAVFALAR